MAMRPPALVRAAGSAGSPAVLWGVVVVVLAVRPVAVMCRVAVWLFVKAPTVHTPVPDTYVPCDGIDDTYCSPLGSASVTTTPVALFGPLFVAVTVNVTFSPTFVVALSTLLLTAISAAVFTGVITVPVQRAGGVATEQVGSPPPLAVALLLPLAAFAATVTFKVSTVLLPAAIVPVNVQLSAVVPVQLQFGPCALARVMAVGSVSVTTMLPAVGPAPVFATVIV